MGKHYQSVAFDPRPYHATKCPKCLIDMKRVERYDKVLETCPECGGMLQYLKAEK